LDDGTVRLWGVARRQPTLPTADAAKAAEAQLEGL